MVLRQWFLEVPFPHKGSSHKWIVCVERGGGGARHTVDGEGKELSWSQCSSSSIDSLNWWKEAFLCSCSPLSSFSMLMIRRLTSRCSPSTTHMSSLSNSKVSWHSQTTCDSTCAVLSCTWADFWNNLFFFSPYLTPVLCTAPNKYTVVDATGAVKPQCCVDMWVSLWVIIFFLLYIKGDKYFCTIVLFHIKQHDFKSTWRVISQ